MLLFQSLNANPAYADEGSSPAEHQAKYPHASDESTDSDHDEDNVDANPADALAFELGGIRWAPFAKGGFSSLGIINPYTREDHIHAFLMRVLLGLDASYGPLRLHSSFEYAQDFGQAPLGLHSGIEHRVYELFLELSADFAWLRLGRQELVYGSKRLIRALPPFLAGRSFDALRLHFMHGDTLELDVMAAFIDLQDTVGTKPNRSDALMALYGTWRWRPELVIEPYLLFRHDTARHDVQRPENTVEARDIANLGLRLHGSAYGFDYESEVMLQLGREDGESHLAYAFVADLWYHLDAHSKVLWEPRLGLGFAYASGNNVFGGTDNFDTFYPFNPLVHGFLAITGLSNLIESHARAQLTPWSKDFTFNLSLHLFALAEPKAPWRNGFGALIAHDPFNEEQLLGPEIDASLIWKPTSYLTGILVYGVFIPATAAKALGKRRATHLIQSILAINLEPSLTAAHQ